MASKQRIMLAEIATRVKLPRQYAVLSAHGTVTLSGGNLTVTGGGAGNQAVRADLSLSAGIYYWETRHTFDAATSPISGIATSAFPLSGQSIALSFDAAGGPSKAGVLYALGDVVGTLGSQTSPYTVSHLYDADSGSYKVRVNGGVWSTLENTGTLSKEPYFPTSSLIGACVIVYNFGATPFSYSVPVKANPGVYIDPSYDTTVYLSSTAFWTGPSESPASTNYIARIASDSDVIIEREASCWVQGGQTKGSRGVLSIVISDGIIDTWADYVWRDSVVKLYKGYKGDARSAFTLWTQCRIETSKADERRLNLTLTDELSSLDRAMQISLYSDYEQNEAIAHKIKPIVIGSPKYCEGILKSTLITGVTAFSYDLSDEPIYINEIYDRGDIFDATPPSSLPLDWGYKPDGRGFKLVNRPIGKIISNPVGAFKVTDIIISAADGIFTAWTGVNPNMVPTGWTVTGNNATNYVQNSSGRAEFIIATQQVRIAQGVLTVGKKYLYKLDVLTNTTWFDIGGNGSGATNRITDIGHIEGMFTATAGTSTFIIEPIDHLIIDNVEVYEVSAIQELTDVLEYVICTRGLVDTSNVDWTTVSNIMAVIETNYTIADYITQPKTFLEFLRKVMDCYCGSLFTARDGRISAMRFDFPSVTSSLSINKNNLLSIPLKSPDQAKGLTTRMSGKKNYSKHNESELVTTISAALKAELMSEYLITRSAQPARYNAIVSEETVEKQVKQSIAADPVETLLQSPRAIQSEISRVATIWRGTAQLWEMDVVLDETVADSIEPGQTVTLTYARLGLDLGRNMLVKRVKNSFFSNVVSLTLFDPERIV